MSGKILARTTGDLVIRELTLVDAVVMAKYFSDRKVLLPVRGKAGTYTLKDSRDFIRRKLQQYKHEKQIMVDGKPEKMGYALIWKGQFIGGIGFTPFDHKAEIGYWLAKPYWGQGIMTKAVRLFVAYLRKKYKFTRFEGKVFSFNLASGRVLVKAGFKKEGVAVHDFRVGKKYFDHMLYGKVF